MKLKEKEIVITRYKGEKVTNILWKTEERNDNKILRDRNKKQCILCDNKGVRNDKNPEREGRN